MVRSVSVVPETVHTLVVAEVNATVSPDDALAVKVSGEAESEAFNSGAKVIVWLAGPLVSAKLLLALPELAATL